MALWNYPSRHPNFSQLDALLKAENWEEADRATSEMIIALATKENAFRRRLRTLVGDPVYSTRQIDNILCKDLITIDQL